MIITALSHSNTSPPLPLPKGAFRLQTSPLRGFRYVAQSEWLHQMKLGDELVLIAEPANPYDKYAVRVHWQQDKHIGYLPRQSNHVVSRLLRQGAPLTAAIAWLDGAAQVGLPLTLHVFWAKSSQ